MELEGTFVFEVDAFGTEWYKTSLYEVEVPLVEGVLVLGLSRGIFMQTND